MQIKNGTLTFHTKDFKKSITFAIGQPVNFPGVLTMDARLEKRDGGERLRVSLIPQNPIEIDELSLQAAYQFSENDKIFCNGFQSWSESDEYGINEELKPLSRTTHIYKMQLYGDGHLLSRHSRHGKLHSHTFTYIRNDNQTIAFVGSLSESNGYTIIHFDPPNHLIHIHKECQGLIVKDYYQAFDLFFAQDNEVSIFNAYSQMITPDYMPAPPLIGWSSRNCAAKINENNLLQILEAYHQKRIPIDIFHIHDGYQSKVGDWLKTNRNFPQKMAYVAERIRDCGIKASIWLAPFICEKKSKFFKEHQDWLAKHPDGTPVVAGASIKWGGNFFALDVTKPEVRDHLKQCLGTVLNTWGFDMVFLDYLYAAAIIPLNGKCRGQIMSEAVRFLGECTGDRMVIGSCVPLGIGWKQFAYCRISAEITSKWEDWLLAKANFRERRSTINSLTSLIGRRHLNQRLCNSVPDIFCVESNNNQFTADQKYTLCLLNNLFGGLTFTSDTVSSYSSNEMRQYGSIFPLRSKKINNVAVDNQLITIHFAIGELEYLAYTNLSDQRRHVQLPEGNYFWRNPFNDNFHFISGSTPIIIPPHASRCYLQIVTHEFGIAGSTAHIFPGSEILEVRHSDGDIDLKQDQRVIKDNIVFVQAPEKKAYQVNGETIDARQFLDQLYVVQVNLKCFT